MADKDTLGSMTDDMPEESAVKATKKSSILPIILKWIAIVLAAGIFVVAITLITVSIRDRRGKGYTDYPTSPEYRDTSEVLTYYTNINELSDNAESVKIEIRNLINDNILTKGKIKRVMIDKYTLSLQE